MFLRVHFTVQWGLLAADEESSGNSRESYVFAVNSWNELASSLTFSHIC